MEELDEYETEDRINKDACNEGLLGVINHLKFIQGYTTDYKLDNFIDSIMCDIEEWTDE